MQMLFIIPLLKTGNLYYIIVNILTDNGENTMQNEKHPFWCSHSAIGPYVRR